MNRFTVDVTERDYYTNYEIIRGQNYKTTGENSSEDAIDELGKIEDLMEKYNVENIEELEKILKIFSMRIQLKKVMDIKII